MTNDTNKALRFVDPKNDVAFKKIFGSDDHHETLIEFLNSVLKLPEPIQSVQIANPFQPPLINGLKGTILDIHASSQHHEFIVEMQVESERSFAKRIFYYTSKAYCSQIVSGEDYALIKPVIFLGIMDFRFFKNDERPVRRHILMDDERCKQDFTEFDFNFIELPKFRKTEAELVTAVDKWLFFLKNASTLHTVPDWADSAGLKSAYRIAEQHNWTQEELDLYDYWKKKEWIHHHALEEAKIEGKIEGKIEVAVALLKQALSIERISEATGLSLAEIKRLKKSVD